VIASTNKNFFRYFTSLDVSDLNFVNYIAMKHGLGISFGVIFLHVIKLCPIIYEKLFYGDWDKTYYYKCVQSEPTEKCKHHIMWPNERHHPKIKKIDDSERKKSSPLPQTRVLNIHWKTDMSKSKNSQESLVMLALFNINCFRYISFTDVRKLRLLTIKISFKYIVKPVLRGHLWNKQKVDLYKTIDRLKEVQLIWNFLWQDKIKVTF
jgi:hypothetical protein